MAENENTLTDEEQAEDIEPTEPDEDDQTPDAGNEPEEGAGGEFTPITTQEEFDKLFNKRWAKQKAKYDELKAKAGQADSLNTELTSLREASATHEAALAKRDARIAELEASIELGAAAQELAAEYGVDASILRGTTRDELEAHAKQIAKTLATPYVGADGKNQSGARVGSSLAGALDRL